MGSSTVQAWVSWIRRLRAGGGGQRVVAEAPLSPAERRDERLSAFIDGQVTADEAATLEPELASDAGLRAELEAMRQVRDALSSLGLEEAPRSFAITAPAASRRGGLPRLELAARLGATAAAVAFVAVLAGDLSTGGGDAGEQAYSTAPVAMSVAEEPPAARGAQSAAAAAVASEAIEESAALDPAAAAADATMDAGVDGAVTSGDEATASGLAAPAAAVETIEKSADAAEAESATPATAAADDGSGEERASPPAPVAAPALRPQPPGQSAIPATAAADDGGGEERASPPAPVAAGDGAGGLLAVEAGLLLAAAALAVASAWLWRSRRRTDPPLR